MYGDEESNSLELHSNNKWVFAVARYVVCILTVLAVKTVSLLLYDVVRKRQTLDVRLLAKIDRHKIVIYGMILTILYNNGQKLYADDFHFVLVAFLIIKYLFKSENTEECCIERHLGNSAIANEIEIINGIKNKSRTSHSDCRCSSCLDDCEIYGIGLAKKLRGFSEEVRAEITYEIDGMIIHWRRQAKAKEWNGLNNNAVITPLSATCNPEPGSNQPEDRQAHFQPSSHSATKSNRLDLTYGVGLACAYIEGYLDIVIPSDGMSYKGFMDNLENFQSNQGVIFPVKKLFIIMTKSMYSPPNLKDFNIETDRNDVAWLESCSSIGQVVKDVAGVKDRLYSTTAYKINRPGRRPVYICAESVGSFITFYKVMKNTNLYEELANVRVEDIVSDFIMMLRRVLPKSHALKNKIELVYFDDSKDLNLADVLLDRVKELESDFEDIIAKPY